MGTLEALAGRSLAGDRGAVESLCRALQGPVYRLAQRMLGDPADAEDATQEILVVVVTHLAQFRGEARLMTWVYTIATRHLLRARASRAESRPVSVDQVASAIDAGLALTRHAAELSDGEARVLARDVQRTCTQAMLFCLTRDERIATLLADLLGATDAVGAELCGVAPEAFRQRLARARAKLRPLLEERCGLVDPARPCRCSRQVIAKRLARRRLPVYEDAEETEDTGALGRAEQQLGAMHRLRPLLGVDPPPAPRADLWAAIVARFPDLLA